MKSNLGIILTISGLFFFAACSNNNGTQAQGNGGDKEVVAGDVSGKTIHLNSATFKEKVMDYEVNTEKWIYAGDKPCIIDFYADWRPPCQRMDRITFVDKAVIEEMGRFVAIKVDLTEPKAEASATARKYGISVIPTYVFINTQGRKQVVSGYTPPARFLELLQSVK